MRVRPAGRSRCRASPARRRPRGSSRPSRATVLVASAPMHVIAHSSTHAPRSASSRHCAAVSFGPARSSVACVSSDAAVARRTPARRRSARPRSRDRSRGSRRARGRARGPPCVSGSSSPSASTTTMPGPGMPSCAATPFSKSWRLLSVGSQTMRRAEAERDLDRGRVHAADLAVAADAAEHRDRVADVSLHRPRERRGGGVVRLQHDRPVAGRGGFAGRLERVDRTGPVRVGPEVAVQIGALRPGRRSSAAERSRPRPNTI